MLTTSVAIIVTDGSKFIFSNEFLALIQIPNINVNEFRYELYQ